MAKAKKEADRARFVNIEVYVVAIGTGVSKADYAALTKESNIFHVSTSAELESLIKEFLPTVCKGIICLITIFIRLNPESSNIKQVE